MEEHHDVGEESDCKRSVIRGCRSVFENGFLWQLVQEAVEIDRAIDFKTDSRAVALHAVVEKLDNVDPVLVGHVLVRCLRFLLSKLLHRLLEPALLLVDPAGCIKKLYEN